MPELEKYMENLSAKIRGIDAMLQGGKLTKSSESDEQLSCFQVSALKPSSEIIYMFGQPSLDKSITTI